MKNFSLTDSAVQMNLLSITLENQTALNQVYNRTVYQST
jgi:hypothetical protein